jgi:hypothetical protein
MHKRLTNSSNPVISRPNFSIFPVLILLLHFTLSAAAATDLIDAQWQHTAPRDEIAPRFSFEEKGGRSGAGTLVITVDEREGLSGQWFKVISRARRRALPLCRMAQSGRRHCAAPQCVCARPLAGQRRQIRSI